MHADLADTSFLDMLYDQAKRCHTANGAGLLLAIKGFLEGRQVYEGCTELWQAADVIANAAASNEREACASELDALCEPDCASIVRNRNKAE